MPEQLTALRVFIASPGGLKSERIAFREVIESVNLDHAHDAGITFIPRGWEYASSGFGRPQELINKQVRESDYLVVLLWDQWGRPPGGASSYTSGTEEEYMVGLECLQDPKQPMRDIVVLFKGVNERQMADPGDDLKKVLAFRSGLEESRTLLYSAFDTIDEFKTDFRRHLHNWVRDWQGEGPPAKNAGPDKPIAGPGAVTIEPDASDEDSHGNDLVARAKAAAERGRLTVAEQLYARATTGTYDRNAFTEYVRFLRKSGRLSLAQMTAEGFLELAQDADDHIGEVEALANLGILERQQGRNPSSLAYLNKALAANEEYLARLAGGADGDQDAALSTKAFLLDNISLTLRRLPGRGEEALLKLDEARGSQDLAKDRRGSGFTLRNKGSLLLRMGRLGEAEESLRDALRIFEEVEYPSGQAQTLGTLAELYEALEDYDSAIELLDRSIAVSPQRTPSRNAMNYAIMSRMHLKRGDADQARTFADACSRFAQELGTTESQATALHCEASLAMYDGNFDIARPALDEALESFIAVENPVGIAAVALDLARLDLAEGRVSDARRSAEQVSAMLQQSRHYVLERELRETLEALAAAEAVPGPPVPS